MEDPYDPQWSDFEPTAARMAAGMAYRTSESREDWLQTYALAFAACCKSYGGRCSKTHFQSRWLLSCKREAASYFRYWGRQCRNGTSMSLDAIVEGTEGSIGGLGILAVSESPLDELALTEALKAAPKEVQLYLQAVLSGDIKTDCQAGLSKYGAKRLRKITGESGPVYQKIRTWIEDNLDPRFFQRIPV